MDSVLKIETYTDQLIFDAGKKAFEAGLREGRQSGEKLGMQLGMAAGRREGLETGRRQALGATLRRLLERDHGRLPLAAIKKVASANPEQLQEWLDQVIDGNRPAALLESLA